MALHGDYPRFRAPDADGEGVKAPAGPYAYKRGAGSHAGRKNDDPEHRLQVAVAEYLKWSMPDDWDWTANAAGVRVSMQTATKMKAAGVRRGWPDLQLIGPDGITRYIELKAGAGLSPEQRAFRDRCIASKERTGRIIWSLAKSVEDVEAALLRFGIQPRRTVATANRYAIALPAPDGPQRF